MKEKEILIKYKIRICEEDTKRCAARNDFANSCPHLYKTDGKYNCSIFEKCVDTGDDDDLGYGFFRCKECLAATNDLE